MERRSSDRHRSPQGSETLIRNLRHCTAHDGDGGMSVRALRVDFVAPVWGPGYGRTWRWEFRGLWPRCRSEDRRSYALWYAARRTGMAGCHHDCWGWTSSRPCGVPAMGGHGDGSFAAFGRDAGLKTGVPMPCGTQRHARTWRWEFRGLWPRCRSEDRRSYALCATADGDGRFPPGRVAGRGSCGRDAGLKTGAPIPCGTQRDARDGAVRL